MSEKKTMFRAKVWRTGTGYVVSIPKIIREALNLKPGDEVTVIIIKT